MYGSTVIGSGTLLRVAALICQPRRVPDAPALRLNAERILRDIPTRELKYNREPTPSV
jgi:hypothetical protein